MYGRNEKEKRRRVYLAWKKTGPGSLRDTMLAATEEHTAIHGPHMKGVQRKPSAAKDGLRHGKTNSLDNITISLIYKLKVRL